MIATSRRTVDRIALREQDMSERCRSSREAKRTGQLGGRCEVSACDAETTKRKPYCLEHLDKMPYVVAVRARADERAREMRAASRGESISATGELARDALLALALGARRLARLGIDVGAQERDSEGRELDGRALRGRRVAKSVTRSLARARLVIVWEQIDKSRGTKHLTARLTPAGRRALHGP